MNRGVNLIVFSVLIILCSCSDHPIESVALQNAYLQAVDMVCDDIDQEQVKLIKKECTNTIPLLYVVHKQSIFNSTDIEFLRKSIDVPSAISHVDFFEVLSVFFGTKNRGDISKWPLDNTIFASTARKELVPASRRDVT